MKPIKVFYSQATGRFYASQHYSENGKGQAVITGKKYDVTDDIAHHVGKNGITFEPVPELPLTLTTTPKLRGPGCT